MPYEVPSTTAAHPCPFLRSSSIFGEEEFRREDDSKSAFCHVGYRLDIETEEDRLPELSERLHDHLWSAAIRTACAGPEYLAIHVSCMAVNGSRKVVPAIASVYANFCREFRKTMWPLQYWPRFSDATVGAKIQLSSTVRGTVRRERDHSKGRQGDVIVALDAKNSPVNALSFMREFFRKVARLDTPGFYPADPPFRFTAQMPRELFKDCRRVAAQYDVSARLTDTVASRLRL